MVGGSSRIPKINILIADFFKKTQLLNLVDRTQAVATGAAIQACLYSREC